MYKVLYHVYTSVDVKVKTYSRFRLHTIIINALRSIQQIVPQTRIA